MFWGGLEKSDETQYRDAASPACDHGWGWVQANESQVFSVVKRFRRKGFGLLAQVHSHPGPGNLHSFGDDSRIFMPFDGMLSIVVPNYGRGGLLPLSRCGVHQFRAGAWIRCVSNLENLMLY